MSLPFWSHEQSPSALGPCSDGTNKEGQLLTVQSIHTSIHPSIHPSIYPSIHLLFALLVTHSGLMIHGGTPLAIFYSFSQFCEIGISLLSLSEQPKTAPHLFQRGVDYGKYDHYWRSLLKSVVAGRERSEAGSSKVCVCVCVCLCVYIYIYIYTHICMRNLLGWLETRLAQNTLY